MKNSLAVALGLIALNTSISAQITGYYAELSSGGTTYGDEFNLDAQSSPISDEASHFASTEVWSRTANATTQVGLGGLDLSVAGAVTISQALGNDGTSSGRRIIGEIRDILTFDNDAPVDVTLGIDSLVSVDSVGTAYSEFYVQLIRNGSTFDHIFGDIQKVGLGSESFIGRSSDNLADYTFTAQPGDSFEIRLYGAVEYSVSRLATNGIGTSSGESMLDLSLFITDISDDLVTYDSVLGMNYSPTAVPEPGTLALLGGIAAFALVVARRRRR